MERDFPLNFNMVYDGFKCSDKILPWIKKFRSHAVVMDWLMDCLRLGNSLKWYRKFGHFLFRCWKGATSSYKLYPGIKLYPACLVQNQPKIKLHLSGLILKIFKIYIKNTMICAFVFACINTDISQACIVAFEKTNSMMT